MAHIALARTDELEPVVLHQARSLMDAAFDGEFGDDDWDHALGGWHVMAWDGDLLLAHASLVSRRLYVADVPVRAGYVEAVGTAPASQGRGLGTSVMEPVAALVAEHFELGALSTSEHGFYERLGWERWHGPTYVCHPTATVRTPDEDDGIMVLLTPSTSGIDRSASIACEARQGDDW
jgi:aminoglycoside 2'-N-acetyltransferase I